jgi:predicted ATPase/transcriptional regulator with XRE-family HTH domain
MSKLEGPLFFGEWLKRRRKALDLTQTELAQLAGCSVFAVRKIESGERRPSKQLAELFAQSLNIPPKELDIFIKVARGERTLERLPLPQTGDDDEATWPPTPVSSPLNNLPISLTPFVGRESELAAIDRLLNDPLCRLLTLIGAGGMGKTRLAIEAAARQGERFSGGICFVPLASLTSSTFLVQAIADALALSFQGQTEPRLQLLDHLSSRQVLLVLDNFEHLLDGVALLAEILKCAPRVKLLTTSRERLNLQSEWVYIIQGLSVPPLDRVDGAEEYTSVKLFIHSARRTQADFSLRSEERLAVVRICQLVEGMPLSIELAAAWVSLLTCAEIAHEIARSFDFLATSATDVPDRQRSQRAVFDHSWNLLSKDERCVLSRLSLFQGEFDRKAALEVANADLPTLLALTSKSLVRRNEKGRFDLHEAVRQYALSHLAEDPDSTGARERHCRFYLALLHDSKDSLQGPTQREVIQELKNDIDNLRLAWNWAVDHGEFALIGEALRSLGWLCNVGVMYREGVEQIESAVQALRASPEDKERQRILGMALTQQGLLRFRQGEFGQAMNLLEESLIILQPLDDPVPLADPLVISGVILHLNGEFDRAQRRFEEGLARAQAAADRFYTAYAIYNLGYVASLLGRYEEGYEQMSVGLALWRELGDPSSIALGLNYLSTTLIHLGRVEEAEAFLQESISLLMGVGDRWGMGTAYRLLGLAALVQGDATRAQALIRESLQMFEGIITGWDVARSLTYLGEATAADGDLAEARAIFRQALEVAMECHATPLILDGLAGLAKLQADAGETESAYALSLSILAHPATSHETSERARQIITTAAERLTTEQVFCAKERAANTPLETIVEMLIAG